MYRILLAILICLSARLEAQQFISKEFRIKIPVDALLDSSGKLLPFSNKSVLNDFVRNEILRHPAIADSQSLKTFLLNAQNPALLVVRHPWSQPEGKFREGAGVVSTILHKEGNQWSDYLLNTRHLMMIIIGGEKDLQADSILLVNRKNALSLSFTDLVKLTEFALAGAMQTITVKIVVFDESSIHPPSDIVLQLNSKSSIKFTIHEWVRMQFRAGVGWNLLKRKNFTMNGSELTVALDKSGKNSWRTNLIALVDFYPWKRDIDRLVPLWERGTAFKQRLGLFAGIQMTHDPLQGFYYGASFAVAPGFSINLGAATALDDVEQSVNLGSISSLKEAKALLRRSYYTRFHMSLSLSPSDMRKLVFGK